jgi:transcriptional regulator with XRE-family HTH domain
MEFCEKLVYLRTRHGYTQTALAERVGVTRQSVYKWEKGESYPEAMTLLALRDLFGESVDTLLDPTLPLGEMGADTGAREARRETVAQQKQAAEEQEAETAPADEQTADGNATAEDGKKKKRGFFSRLFG